MLHLTPAPLLHFCVQVERSRKSEVQLKAEREEAQRRKEEEDVERRRRLAMVRACVDFLGFGSACSTAQGRAHRGPHQHASACLCALVFVLARASLGRQVPACLLSWHACRDLHSVRCGISSA